MNITLFLIVALVAVAFALIAWARAAFQNAKKQSRLNGVQFANIGEGTFERGVKSYLPDATTSSRYLIYKIGTDADHVAVAGAGDTPIGQSDDQADDVTVPIAIALFGLGTGMLRVITDGTIANGDYVKTGASGKATKASNGDAGCFGRAIFGTDTSSANGDVITVVHDVPMKFAF